jgi:uncharacterized protein (TIGR02231 family)
MRVPIAAGLALLVAVGLARAAEPQALTTQITAVTVYADRAQVTRSGTVDLTAEPTRFTVTRLPGWIDVESVRVALDPSSAGQVLDVAVETAYLAQASEESTRVAQAAARDVGDELAAMGDEERTLGEEIARLEALRALSLDKVPRELAVGEVKLKNLGETMSFVTETVRSDRKQLRALAKKRRDLEPVLAQRQKELSDLQARSQLQQSTVVVELKGSGRAQVRIAYLTPGAAWEPQGELRVSRGGTGGTTVTVLQTASVMQTTGEDWTAAKLSFSTQNPSDMLDVPRAKRLVLDRNGQGLGAVIDNGGESFSRAQARYAALNESVAKAKIDWRDSLQRQTEAQGRAVERFSKISSRGTTAHFAALSERTVRADGKPVRVPIASGDFLASTRLVAVPEISLNAVRVVDLVNGGSTPILPARVMLYEDGAFVGRSELEFVAPGESFSAFLGVHDGVKLERALDRKSSALRRRGKRTEMALSFVVSAENLGSTPQTIEMSERIPIAQTEEIEVSDVDLPRKLKPDAQGVVRWTETIPARTKLTWRVGYRLEYPTDFVARSRAADEHASPTATFDAEERAAPAAATPAAKTQSKSRKMYEQIDQLENSF